MMQGSVTERVGSLKRWKGIWRWIGMKRGNRFSNSPNMNAFTMYNTHMLIKSQEKIFPAR